MKRSFYFSVYWLLGKIVRPTANFSHELNLDREILYVPIGFAHGFAVLSDSALFHYKCSDYYCPEGERGILWNDPDLGIEWPIESPIISERDAQLPRLREVSPFDLMPSATESV